VARLATSAIEDCAFQRHFYDEQHVSEEIHILAEHGGLDYYACFFRNSSQPAFGAADVEVVERYAGLALRALRRQMELRGAIEPPLPARADALSAANRDALLARIRQALSSDRTGLSPRESEICAHIALGYAANGIALKLGISVHTVATHRKRAYAKLGISSQNELFARYLDSLANLRPRQPQGRRRTYLARAAIATTAERVSTPSLQKM
jgi:DNA-binding CsgD family transcriptional regulator